MTPSLPSTGATAAASSSAGEFQADVLFGLLRPHFKDSSSYNAVSATCTHARQVLGACWNPRVDDVDSLEQLQQAIDRIEARVRFMVAHRPGRLGTFLHRLRQSILPSIPPEAAAAVDADSAGRVPLRIGRLNNVRFERHEIPGASDDLDRLRQSQERLQRWKEHEIPAIQRALAQYGFEQWSVLLPPTQAQIAEAEEAKAKAEAEAQARQAQAPAQDPAEAEAQERDATHPSTDKTRKKRKEWSMEWRQKPWLLQRGETAATAVALGMIESGFEKKQLVTKYSRLFRFMLKSSIARRLASADDVYSNARDIHLAIYLATTVAVLYWKSGLSLRLCSEYDTCET
eukprot:TRINITY_DN217_c0_g2_i2.p1 TRINITY_DN217_c0_g2~~TRINITY_DN217_c0_g2_i2.p1  ORF type:complete len:344 (-),score=53.06 TRINITY_DN217_c0_g2_i2:276-1307(-)